MALLNREKQAAVQQLPIGEITPSPHQTRRDFHEEELAALAQSIDRSGLLNPISVRALPQGGYCLIAGERRWRACQMLGWSRIPALVWQKDDAGAAALTLAENLHRSDLHYIEEAEGILRLIAQCGLSQNEAAALLAMSPSALCNKLRLLRLSPAVQQALIENNIPERLARALLQLPDEDLQQRAIRHMAAEELNVRQGEEYLRQLLHRQRLFRSISRQLFFFHIHWAYLLSFYGTGTAPVSGGRSRSGNKKRAALPAGMPQTPHSAHTKLRLPLLCFAERCTVEAVLFRRTQRRRRTVGENAVVFVF